MPPDSDIFLMRDKERQRKKQVYLHLQSIDRKRQTSLHWNLVITC